MKKTALATVLASVAFGGLATAQVPPAPAVPRRTAAKWLVDLGRDYPLSPQASLTDADAELTLVFMEAAARIDPSLAEAWLWQHNMLWALHREADAVAALERYASIEKDDWTARTSWVAMKTDLIESAEPRLEFWQNELAKPGLPPETASDLRRRIGEYHLNRGNLEAAQREAEQAIRLFPENLAARQLAARAASDSDSPARQVALALEMIRLSPAQALLAWDLAVLLDGQSLHREAQRWYQHALAVFEKANPGERPPADFVLDMAASQMDAGSLDSAEKLIRQTLAADPRMVRALRLSARVARKRGRTEEVKQLHRQIREAYGVALERTRRSPNPDLLAEAAWYYCIQDLDIERAYALAKDAMQAASPSVAARRAYGYAAAEKGLAAEARRVLEPVADRDPWSAIALARALEKEGDTKTAAALLTKTAAEHASGQLLEEASARLAALKAPVPPPDPHQAITDLLARFDDAPLAYCGDPKKYVELRIEPLAASLRCGDALWCRFTLRNKGPFVITLGEELMVSPTVLVVARSKGDRERLYGGLQRVALNRRQALRPGESIEVLQTLDVGPLRATLIATPQAEQTIEITGILSPAWSEDRQAWMPRLGGFEVGPVQVVRRAAPPDDAGPDGLAAAIRMCRSGTEDERIDAVQRIMMWLAEDQHLRAGRLAYAHQAPDRRAAEAAVLERFSDPSWQVRARLAEALRWIVLDDAMTRSGSAMLNDPHWLVRMLTARCFADHHGAKFDKVAAHFAESDPDPLVRRACAALRQRGADPLPATTEPAAGR